MAEYVIGDIHGHYRALKKLTEVIKFKPGRDTLFFVGDLINGDKKNVEVLEFIMDLEGSVATLGNHDLSALAVYFGTRKPSAKSTIGDLLEHPNSNLFFDWLRHCPLAHLLPNGDLLTHAGIPAEWDFGTALKRSHSVEHQLQKDDPSKFLIRMFEPAPNLWELCQTKKEKDVFTVNSLTRQRALFLDGTMDFDFKSTLDDMPANLTPWFTYRFEKRYFDEKRLKKGKKQKYTGPRIFFGHWSALGYHKDLCATCLDSGVRWGGPLTALRLEDYKIFQARD